GGRGGPVGGEGPAFQRQGRSEDGEVQHHRAAGREELRRGDRLRGGPPGGGEPEGPAVGLRGGAAADEGGRGGDHEDRQGAEQVRERGGRAGGIGQLPARGGGPEQAADHPVLR